MREFDLLPNEAEILTMAREYGRMQARREVLSRGLCGEGQSEKVCEEIVRKSEEMECCMRKLYCLAPVRYRADIRKMIMAKRRGVERLGGKVASRAADEMPDAYCAALQFVSLKQAEFISLLIDSSINDIKFIEAEIFAATSLNRLAIYCA